jgi:hypothetical protein
MHHLRPRPDNFFFKHNNPVFANDTPKIIIPVDEDGNTLEYMKSQEQKYEPRKNRKIQDTYKKMEAVAGVRKTLAQTDLNELIEMCILSPSSFDLAMMLYKHCGKKFRCIDNVNSKWQKYDNATWTNDDTCISTIKYIISGDLCDFFRNKLTSLRTLQSNNYISGEFSAPINLKCKNIEYIVNRLVTVNMKNMIVKDATELFFYSEI